MGIIANILEHNIKIIKIKTIHFHTIVILPVLTKHFKLVKKGKKLSLVATSISTKNIRPMQSYQQSTNILDFQFSLRN